MEPGPRGTIHVFDFCLDDVPLGTIAFHKDDLSLEKLCATLETADETFTGNGCVFTPQHLIFFRKGQHTAHDSKLSLQAVTVSIPRQLFAPTLAAKLRELNKGESPVYFFFFLTLLFLHKKCHRFFSVGLKGRSGRKEGPISFFKLASRGHR